MRKASLAAVLLLISFCAATASAQTWFFKTQATNAGGSITSDNLASQRSTDGIIFRSYTSDGPRDVSVAADPGYSIRNVTVNDLRLGAQGTRYHATVRGPSDQSVIATFLADPLAVTASNPGGTVTPASIGNISYGYTLRLPLTFTFTPARGCQITGIDNIPSDPKVSYTNLSPGVNKRVSVTFDTGYTFTSSVLLQARVVNLTPAILPIRPQTVVVGTRGVPLNAVTVNVATPRFAWTYLSGPANMATVTSVNGKLRTDVTPGPPVTIADPTSASTTFDVPAQPGQYKFQVTVASPGQPPLVSLATVSVYASAYQTARNQCQFCHFANRIGPDDLFANWSASAHRARGITCAKCHIGTDAGGHFGTTTGNVCRTCHADSQGNIANHPFTIGSTICTSCHNPHATTGIMTNIPAVHYNNATSAGYPASYVTSRSSCGDCHNTGVKNGAVRGEWATSGHAATRDAAWSSQDFKTRAGCVICHTTTGFVAYSTGRVTAAWGSSMDKSKEVLTCIGCHSDVAAGTVRRLAPLRALGPDSFLNHDVGISNVCMGCHSGSNNGATIAALVGQADFTALPFIAPHHLPAAAVLQGEAGYHFAGRSYPTYSTNSHSTVSVANKRGTGTDGPCIGCHMSSAARHSYRALSTASNGTVTAVTSTTCANCHAGYLDPTVVEGDRVDFNNALTVLKAALNDRGFAASGDYPYFTATDWGVEQAGADAMGAAYNYRMLLSEPGAYAHNGSYTRKLIIDSVDALANGKVTGSVDSAVASLVGKGAIDQPTADRFLAYRSKSPCGSCHGFTAETSTPMSSQGHAAHISAAYGPGTYLGADLGACLVCHVFQAATHDNGTVDLAGGACNGCHPGGPPTWSNASRIDCRSCHGAAPSVLPNGVAAPNKSSFDSVGHGRFPASALCTDCHDPNSRHISGSPGSYTRLIATTSSLCNSCHNDAGTVRSAFLNMSTHFLVKGGGQDLPCFSCHDPHGTANLSMIAATIKGVAIVFTNTSTGFVDTVTNTGLCQVCHTATAHFRAGVPETSHPVKGCLKCHSHNAPGGAFKASCSGCHGYPPIPAGTPLQSFGTLGNWSSARFEDYSGGGGAHLLAAHVPRTARASQGWNNCTPCHNAGAAGHTMALPIADHRDNVRVAVAPAFAVPGTTPAYDGASRTCSNVSCHSVPAGTFTYTGMDGAGDTVQITASYGGTAQETPTWGATGDQCTACHANPPYVAPNQYVWHSGWHGNVNLNSAQNPDVLGYNRCDLCHADVTTSITGTPGTPGARMTSTITNPSQHRNGAADVAPKWQSRCFGCH